MGPMPGQGEGNGHVPRSFRNHLMRLVAKASSSRPSSAMTAGTTSWSACACTFFTASRWSRCLLAKSSCFAATACDDDVATGMVASTRSLAHRTLADPCEWAGGWVSGWMTEDTRKCDVQSKRRQTKIKKPAHGGLKAGRSNQCTHVGRRVDLYK